MTIMRKLSSLARSPQARQLADRAKQVAKDPKTRQQIDAARRRIADRRGGRGPGA